LLCSFWESFAICCFWLVVGDVSVQSNIFSREPTNRDVLPPKICPTFTEDFSGKKRQIFTKNGGAKLLDSNQVKEGFGP